MLPGLSSCIITMHATGRPADSKNVDAKLRISPRQDKLSALFLLLREEKGDHIGNK